MAQTQQDSRSTSTADVSAGIIPDSINPDIQKERDNAMLNKELITQMTYIIDGGKEFTERRRHIESCLFQDPLFSERDRYLRTSAETFDLGVKRSLRMIDFKKTHSITFSEIWDIIYRALSNEQTFGIHDLMFVTFIENQGTEEQKARWLDEARNMRMLGTYAQTELGHGTYIPGLETTATYDPSSQEFIINTPTLTSMKWWPGALGKTSTHAVVLAQLIIGGKNYGPHAFMVQLRSLQDHCVLPGRSVGVIGDKWNYAGTDNGYLRLRNVRIPRADMFMKYFQVSSDGVYTKQGNPKVLYSTMMVVRLKIVQESWQSLARALVTGIRYSAIRKQGPMDRGGPEVSILDYQTQQEKLLPGLATAYAFNAVGKRLQQVFNKVQADISKEHFSSLPELHALCCGLKSFTTGTAVGFIESVRLACGGHGYLLSSGIPYTYSRTAGGCTYEGENTVMMLQVARYLLKSAYSAQNGIVLAESVAYLAVDTSGESWSACTESDVRDTSLLIKAFQHRAHRLVNHVGQRVARLMGEGHSQGTAWNNSTIDLVHAAKAHVEFYTVVTFCDVIKTLSADPTILKILQTLSCFYAVFLMDKNIGDFMQDGYVTSDQAEMVHSQYFALLAHLRPEAVPLVDAFDFTDLTIHSVLGCYDGNAYERLYEHALRDPKNKTEIHETYSKYLKPLLTGQKSKL
ncbi:peroxisomal acyl-coenzyme A oxidase 1-like [Asterias rubens]|uniref:peroxisomal acyl-coenzyme A oxidase 1-like n=1 Tax=Asterias rubens TaxID=7604 RepID=UPI0014554170|nr:peroxisomal acyl-coenzyme A oxidase 1-like [Asterias rubens]